MKNMCLAICIKLHEHLGQKNKFKNKFCFINTYAINSTTNSVIFISISCQIEFKSTFSNNFFEYCKRFSINS